MLIQKVHVKNFRSILDESLPCDSLTALVGRNGSGKSSFLSAIELFYNPSAKITAEDFYSEDTTQDIEIAVTFTGLSTEAKDLFSAYIDNDVMTVVRVFSYSQGKNSGTYHGMRLQNPDFVCVRNASGKMNIRKKYNEIREIQEYFIVALRPFGRGGARSISRMGKPEPCTMFTSTGRWTILWIQTGRPRRSRAIHQLQTHTSSSGCTGRCY